MPEMWLNVAQRMPDGGIMMVPSFEQFPLVVLSTTPLFEAVEDADGREAD